MKNLLFITFLSMFIIACNNKSSSANATDKTLTKDEIVKKFNLPPEPDSAINNSTIQGVDSNSNNIRDDWEREIAFEHYQDLTMVNINNLIAQNYTALNNAYEQGDVSEYENLDNIQSELIACAYYFNEDGFGSENLENMENNTFERFQYNLKRDAEISKYLGSDLDRVSITDEKETCSKYSK